MEKLGQKERGHHRNRISSVIVQAGCVAAESRRIAAGGLVCEISDNLVDVLGSVSKLV